MKMTEWILIIVVAITIGFSWFKKAKAQPINSQRTIVYDIGEAEEFVKRLEDLGYFKYADHSDLNALKENMLNSYDPDGELLTILDERTNTPKDYRYYMCDGEEVYEEGGITTLLSQIKPTFEKINFVCNVTNHFEEWDDQNQWLNHRITINGTEYVVFKNFKELGWGEAPKRISEILNIELSKQGIDERIFLASGGNDGRLVFLTDELYKYIYSVYKNPNWKPLELDEWAKTIGVKPMKLD